MAALDEQLNSLGRALKAMCDRGPGYCNQLPSEFPLDEIVATCGALAKVCAALGAGGEEHEDALLILQLDQSRLLAFADHLPARGPYEPLDNGDQPSVDAFRNLFGDVIIELGRTIETFPRAQREAARPTTNVEPVAHETVHEEVETLKTQIENVKTPVERLQAKIASDIKAASDNTVLLGLINIKNITFNLNLDLVAFARFLGDKWIKVDWGALLYRNLSRLARVLTAAVAVTQAIQATLSIIMRVIDKELATLLEQSRNFLARYVEIPEDGELAPPGPQGGREDQPPPLKLHPRQHVGPILPKMVVLRAGTFLMGSPDKNSPLDRELFLRHGGTKEDWEGLHEGIKDEHPYHEVRIARSIAVGCYPVTFEEYDRFAEATVRDKPRDNDWGRGRRPVIDVSWGDAKAYAEWLARETGTPYRLLSEAEWEYACRAETRTNYNWGNRAPGAKDTNFWAKPAKTTMVGSYPANGWGLHDMHGNIWEWVEDCWHDSYAAAPSDGSAWTSGGDRKSRVLRGGSWYVDRLIRNAARNKAPASNRDDDYGFRIARTLD